MTDKNIDEIFQYCRTMTANDLVDTQNSFIDYNRFQKNIDYLNSRLKNEPKNKTGQLDWLSEILMLRSAVIRKKLTNRFTVDLERELILVENYFAHIQFSKGLILDPFCDG
jgi:hypothetical protein